KMVKQPDSYIKKLTMKQHRDYVKRLEEEKPYFDVSKRKAFIETLAVNLFVIFPSLTKFNIINETRKLGICTLDLRQTLLKCGTPITDAMVAKIEEAMPTFVNEIISTGQLTDATYDSLLPPTNGSVFPLTDSKDGLPLRNQRVVLLTHPQTKARH